jgi:hypothetical protein
MIPAFNNFGHLPVGGHYCTWEEFYERFRVNDCRISLCEKLQEILVLARHCGFLRVMIGGSFPTATVAPRDMDLTWITDFNVEKKTVKPECVKLMDAVAAREEYDWDMMYLPIDHDNEQVQDWARNLGFCTKTLRDRGTLVIDL